MRIPNAEPMTMLKISAMKKFVTVTEIAGHNRRALSNLSSARTHSNGGGK
jgi:hypothetical protein